MAQVHTVGRASGSAASPSPSPQSGAVKANQPNPASTPVKNLELSSTGGQVTAPPGSSKSKAKSKSILNGPNAQVPIPATTQANGAALAKSAASAAIVEAIHGHSNGNGSFGTTDRNEFVREVLTLINVRRLPSHMSRWPFIHVISFPSDFPLVLVLIDRFLVRGLTLDGISCARVAYVGALVYLLWRTCWIVARDFRETVTGTSPYRWSCEWDGGLALASPTIGSCQG